MQDGSIVFVKWTDTWTVLVCSSIHAAHSEETEHMGGEERSDQLIQCYSAQHETMQWRRIPFLPFPGHSHQQLLHSPQRARGFMEQLTAEVPGRALNTPSGQAAAIIFRCLSVTLLLQAPAVKATTGCKTCELFQKQSIRRDTPRKCKVCEVALCLQLDRNCLRSGISNWKKRTTEML